MLSADLQKRLFGVIYQAERAPAADWSIATMAQATGLAPYYFQRAFRSLTGESVKQYVLRVRLQRRFHLILRTLISIRAALCVPVEKLSAR